MDIIYTDREQCEDFSVKYFGAAKLTIAADTLLRSKGSGYDEQHTTFLRSLGGRTLVLSRTEKDPIGPGWWSVKEVL
jgi:hypothetical protein